MTGIGRFFSLVLCVGLVMICFPDFGVAGWTFAGTIIFVWTAVILLMAIVGSLFALDRFGGINHFLTVVFVAAVLLSALWYFPQEDKVSPINKLKYGQLPTGADIKRGLDKMTFNFAFDKRNARSEKNFINQQDPKALEEEAAKKKAAEEARKAAIRASQKLEVVVED